jgi:hypothetical protein
MQFGSDEDLSGCAGQCSNRPEIAWAAAYSRGHFTPLILKKHPRNSHSVQLPIDLC